MANKIDLEDERKVTTQQIKELAGQFGFNFHETSAKMDIGMKETFEDIFKQSYRNKFEAPPTE